jgi:hypothetical protein
MKKFIITESEKNNIRKMYGLINESNQFDCIANNPKFIKVQDGYKLKDQEDYEERLFKEDGTYVNSFYNNVFKVTWKCVNGSPVSYWVDNHGGVYYNDYTKDSYAFDKVQKWPEFLKKIIDKYKPSESYVYQSQSQLMLLGVNVDGVAYDLNFNPSKNTRWYKKGNGNVWGEWLGTFDFDDASQKIILTPTFGKNQNIKHSGGTITEQDTDCSAIFDKKKIMKVGSKGPLVRAIRKLFDVAEGDTFDNNLKQKVIEFQKNHQLPTTGNVGVKTLTTITKYYIPDFCENPVENAHWI